MRAEARDDWLGWGGNPRRSDLTWRRSPLPRGHELSLTAGVIVLFPGPLKQVRQRRRGQIETIWLVFTHTTQIITYFLSSLAITSVPPLFIIHMRVYDQYSSIYVCVCVWAWCSAIICCVYTFCVTFPELCFPAYVGVNFYFLSDGMTLFSQRFIHLCCLIFFFCVSASSLSTYAFHNPSLYTVLFRLQLPIVLRLNRSVVTAEKPDTLRLDVCIMFICAVVVYPSFHLSTSFRLLLPVT